MVKAVLRILGILGVVTLGIFLSEYTPYCHDLTEPELLQGKTCKLDSKEQKEYKDSEELRKALLKKEEQQPPISAESSNPLTLPFTIPVYNTSTGV